MYPAYYHNGRRYKAAKGMKLLLYLLALLVVIKSGGYLAVWASAQPHSGRGILNLVMSWSERDPCGILRVGIPLLAWVSNGGEDIPQIVSPSDLAAPLFRMFRLDRQHPLDLLQSEIPLLAAAVAAEKQVVTSVTPVAREELIPDEESVVSPVPLSEESLVAIYNTHTGETYALTDGLERLHEKRGGVVKVAEALERELEEKYGIRVARSDVIHDANYSTSYARSQETLRGLLADNPSTQVVLDIHRDAGKSRENSIVTVNGQTVAPVLIVVGSDARAPFPTWRQNYNFARELAAEIDRQHPGLCLGVRIKEGRYNQFLHPRAVLLEVGSVSNSTEEAVRSARLLAGPVAEMVRRCLDGEE